MSSSYALRLSGGLMVGAFFMCWSPRGCIWRKVAHFVTTEGKSWNESTVGVYTVWHDTLLMMQCTYAQMYMVLKCVNPYCTCEIHVTFLGYPLCDAITVIFQCRQILFCRYWNIIMLTSFLLATRVPGLNVPANYFQAGSRSERSLSHCFSWYCEWLSVSCSLWTCIRIAGRITPKTQGQKHARKQQPLYPTATPHIMSSKV